VRDGHFQVARFGQRDVYGLMCYGQQRELRLGSPEIDQIQYGSLAGADDAGMGCGHEIAYRERMQKPEDRIAP